MKKKHIYSKEEKIKMFGEGPWCDEPDIVAFESHGMECLVKRIVVQLPGYIFGGHLCGYVFIPKSHPLYEKEDISNVDDHDVYGGITFSNFLEGKEWTIGFDCSHYLDTVPSMKKFERIEMAMGGTNRVYRDIDFAIKYTKRLAKHIRNSL